MLTTQLIADLLTVEVEGFNACGVECFMPVKDRANSYSNKI